eukprot:Gb_21321 [translate_table: standard]
MPNRVAWECRQSVKVSINDSGQIPPNVLATDLKILSFICYGEYLRRVAPKRTLPGSEMESVGKRVASSFELCPVLFLEGKSNELSPAWFTMLKKMKKTAQFGSSG